MGMTREEFKLIAKGINAIYPDAIGSQASFDMWYAVLQDMTYEMASVATQKYIATGHFAPKPADIRECARFFHAEQNLNENEAWSLVSVALKKSTYYAQEEFEKLPPAVQKAVGSSSQLRSWAMDEDFNEGVASSNFMKVYRQVAERERQIDVLPQSIKDRLGMNPTAMIEGKE